MLTTAAINPGVFDRRIVLSSQTTTRNAIGEAVEAWATAATVWARWLPQNSRDFIQAQARWAELSGVLRIRYRSDVLATWRVSLGGNTYELAGPPIEIGRREYLDLPVFVRNPEAPAAAGTGLTTFAGDGITTFAGDAVTLLEGEGSDAHETFSGETLEDFAGNPITPLTDP